MKSKCANFACVLLYQMDDICTSKEFQKFICFPGNRHLKKNVLFLSVNDLYAKMLTILTHSNVAQWYITGLQM